VNPKAQTLYPEIWSMDS